MEEWKEYKLGDISTMKYGKLPPSSTGKLYPIWSGYRYVGMADTSNCSKGTMVVVARGVGGTGDVKVAKEDCYLTNLSIAVDLSPHVCNPYYLYYKYLIRNLKYLDSGSAQSQITIDALKNLLIELPPLDYQNRIVSVFKSIDDKIEVNKRINENLEQQAQALFKSWFVDFEPFKNGEFVESELGMIPKGWRVGKLGELCVTNKRTYKGEFNVKIKYIDTGSVTNNFIESSQILDPTCDKIPSRAKRAVVEGDIIYSSVRPNQKHYALLFSPSANTVVSTGFIVITSNWSAYRYFIYEFLIQDGVIDNLQAIAEQSVSTFPSINASDITNLKVVIPPNEIVVQYANIAFSHYNKINNNQQESRRLAELRDTLLPKLMSGEFKVNEIVR